MENNRLNNDFSIAAQRDAEQTRLAAEQERQRQIAQIREQNERHQIEEMIMMRDKKLELEKERAEREEKAIYEREVQKRIAAKEEMHLNMDKVRGLSLEEQKKNIQQAVRNSHGVELDQHRRDLEQTLNKEIDREIEKTLERQREQDRQRQEKRDSSLSYPWERSAFKNDRMPWENQFDRSEGRSRGRDDS